MNANVMTKITAWIEQNYAAYAVPVRIKNEKRWESMDEIIPPMQPLEGVPQNLRFDDTYGVVLYSFTLMKELDKEVMVQQYHKLCTQEQ